MRRSSRPPRRSAAKGGLAFVVSCEHGGHGVPTRYRSLFRGASRVLASHRGWDPGALDLARAIARACDAPLVATTTSRLLVECNRSLDHPRLFSEFSRVLGQDERERVVDRYYRPHRRAVETAVRGAMHGGRCVVHVGVHTFTPVLAGRRRTADVGLLYDPARAAEAVFCEVWAETLQREGGGLRVKRNYPYRGWTDGLTTALRGAWPPSRYLGIELEVNQALVLGSAARWKRTRETIARSLSRLLAEG